MGAEHQSRTISVWIARDWRDVYTFASPPETFSRWASGLGKPLGHDGAVWQFDNAEGPVTVRFCAPNDYGVFDHYVRLPDGSELYIPLRVVANGTGSEVLFTLFRAPGMSDEKFAADAQWVERDLLALKVLLEA